MINNFRGDYAFLSNFHPAIVTYEFDVYPTTEHAYQAAKSLDLVIRKQIQEAKTPGDAKKLGQPVEKGGIVKLRKDWENVKVSIMKFILIQKFKQEKFKHKLIATGTHVLIEGNWWHDNFWGTCHCDKCIEIFGNNHLGRLLVSIREQLMRL
jgi:ribA/ribD-fused uncharacterized protein